MYIAFTIRNCEVAYRVDTGIFGSIPITPEFGWLEACNYICTKLNLPEDIEKEYIHLTHDSKK